MMAGMSVADVPVVTRNDDLLDGNLIRRRLAWGFVWLLVFPTVGAVVAAKFNHPDFLGGVAWLSFGWTDVNLGLLQLGPSHIAGINNAAWHGLFIHYVVGLWITPAGYVIIYYFLPASLRAPLYSHKLSLIGFWSLAFFYPFVGIHHYLYAPIAEWAQTIAIVSSMMLIIPVWTVIQNFFGTVGHRWRGLGSNLPAKFLITGSLMYLVGCFQGSIEALRVLQRPTHFTDFVIGHSHITIFGTFVIWALAGAVYVWPRITASAPWSLALGNGAFWLITAGITAMFVVLVTQGL